MGPPAHFATDVGPTARIRIARLLRAPAVVVGKLLVLLGAVALLLSIGISVILAATDDPPPTSGDWLVAAGFGGGGVVAIVIGRRSVRGRRHLVLFLRKFGYHEATAATSYAAERAMGRRWRLVTLDDDSATAPIGVTPATRRRSNLLGVLGVVVLIGSISASAYWVLGGGMDEAFDAFVDSTYASFEEQNPDASFGESIGAAIVTAMVAGLAFGLLLIFGMIVLLAVWTTCADLWLTRLAVRRADRSKSWRIDSVGAAQAIADRIRSRARRVHAPRMFVVRAADPVWQDAVRALADGADAVVVDISRPTENLVWEVRELRRRPAVTWVLVCARDSEVVRGSSADPWLDELLALIRGEQVLVYSPGDVEDRRFARSLRNQLDRSLHGG